MNFNHSVIQLFKTQFKDQFNYKREPLEKEHNLSKWGNLKIKIKDNFIKNSKIMFNIEHWVSCLFRVNWDIESGKNVLCPFDG